MEKYWKPWMTALGLATVWIWFCLGSVVWSLFVVLQWFGVEDKAADWVQAIGTVVAILAAGYFPVRHLEVARQKREQSLLELMNVLGSQASEAIWMLSNSFLTPEYEKVLMTEYVQNHRAKDFEPLLAGLNQISVAELPPLRVVDLGRIRGAVQFAENVAAQLPAWLEAGSSNPSTLVTLRGKRDLLDLTVGMLPSVAGKPSVENQARLIGQKGERFLEPVVYWEAKIYRQYYWRDGQEVPQMVRVQIVKPNVAEHPDTFEINALGSDGWDTFEEVESIVLHNAQGKIRVWKLYANQMKG